MPRTRPRLSGRGGPGRLERGQRRAAHPPVRSLQPLIVAMKALAGLIVEGLIMLAAPLVLVLVLRSGHAAGARSNGSHADAVGASLTAH